MKPKKFTFKTVKPTGSYSSFYPNHNYIKLNKIQVGTIKDKLPHRIKLMVIKEDINSDGNPNCKWEWVTLKREFNTIQEAKDFLNDNIDSMLEKFKLKT
jgi:hypothetical protein